MHSYGIGDAFAADELCPHFYDLHVSLREIIQPLIDEKETNSAFDGHSNDQIFAMIDDVGRMVNSHPEISRYFGIQIHTHNRQMIYFGFKTIQNLHLYKTGAPDNDSNATSALVRDNDWRGHCFEQMLYALVFVVYCLAQPRKKHPYSKWRKLLKTSGIPLYEKNAKERDVISWLMTHEHTLNKAVRLHEEWKRGEAVIRLSPLEARMIAFMNGNDDVSPEAINATINSSTVETGMNGIAIHFPKRDDVSGSLTIDQGQAFVEIGNNHFELSDCYLDIKGELPETAISTLRRQPVERICSIGVFEGLGMKAVQIRNSNGSCRIDLKNPTTGIEYVLSREALKVITG